MALTKITGEGVGAVDSLDVNGASILGAPGTFYVGDDGGSVGAFLNQTASLPLRLMTSGSERLRVLSGGGLTCNGDTAAANVLEDYEEGTWTPTYGGSSSNPSVTHDFQDGQYVKIGKIVIASFFIGTDAVSATGSGSLLVNGLPFTSRSGRDFMSGPPLAYSFSSTISDVVLGISGNTTAIIIYINNNTAGTHSTGQLVDGTNKNRLSGTVIYEVP